MTQTHPPFQIAWGRYLFSFFLLPLLIRPRELKLAFRSNRPGLQFARSILLVSTTCTFFYAIKYIPLADAIAIGFASPLLATALAIPHPGREGRVAALVSHPDRLCRRADRPAAGFRGSSLGPYFLPLAVAAMMATYNVLTRLVNRYDSAQTSIAFNNTTGHDRHDPGDPVAAWSMVRTDGHRPGGTLVALGAFGTAGHFCLILAYRYAPVSTLAPFTYTHMVLAVIVGLVVFGDMPDPADLDRRRRYRRLGHLCLPARSRYCTHRARHSRTGPLDHTRRHAQGSIMPPIMALMSLPFSSVRPSGVSSRS